LIIVDKEQKFTKIMRLAALNIKERASKKLKIFLL